LVESGEGRGVVKFWTLCVSGALRRMTLGVWELESYQQIAIIAVLCTNRTAKRASDVNKTLFYIKIKTYQQRKIM